MCLYMFTCSIFHSFFFFFFGVVSLISGFCKNIGRKVLCRGYGCSCFQDEALHRSCSWTNHMESVFVLVLVSLLLKIIERFEIISQHQLNEWMVLSISNHICWTTSTMHLFYSKTEKLGRLTFAQHWIKKIKCFTTTYFVLKKMYYELTREISY